MSTFQNSSQGLKEPGRIIRRTSIKMVKGNFSCFMELPIYLVTWSEDINPPLR